MAKNIFLEDNVWKELKNESTRRSIEEGQSVPMKDIADEAIRQYLGLEKESNKTSKIDP